MKKEWILFPISELDRTSALYLVIAEQCAEIALGLGAHHPPLGPQLGFLLHLRGICGG
jgi:hypothetical protein